MLLFLGLGFPFAILLAWAFEGHASPTTAAGPARSGAVDWLLTAALAIVIGIFAYQQIVAPSVGGTAERASIASSSATPSDISIAVLPFVNLSSDKEQEFFSDGMTEEITSALAKVPNLRVVGRTSAFQFKGENKDLRAIGQSLGASHLIEGSVRKDGNQVRITAQLIKADDGTHLWTENYDRELKGIFAVQEDIAQAIAVALRVPLGLQQGETLVRNRTDDLESYQQYLRAKTLIRARVIDDGIAILDPLVRRNPTYAPAWGMLAYAYTLATTYGPVFRSGSEDEARRVLQSNVEKVEAAGRKAIEFDPRFALGYAALALSRNLHLKWIESENLYRQALVLDPADPEVLHSYRQLLAITGRLKEALRVSEQVQTLEPFVPNYTLATAHIMQINGQSAATIPLIEAVSANAATSFNRNSRLAMAYAAAGRFGDAADTLLAIRGGLVSRQSVEDAARLIRGARARVSTTSALPVLQGELNFVYGYVGAAERVFEYYERNLQIGIFVFPVWLWDPLYAPLRKTERFKGLMRNAGLVEYWRERGWPDLCQPVGTDDFTCD